MAELTAECLADLSSRGPRYTSYPAGVDLDRYFARELDNLATHAGLATYDPTTRTIHTTPIGRMLVRNVCMVFDRYHHDEARFSSTI